MNEPSSKTPLISKGWIQAVALVMLFGFFTMGLLAYYTYTDEPPIPAQVVDANGKVLFTGKDIIAGQEDLSQKRADGIRLDFRSRRVAGAGFHGGLSASRRRNDDRLTMAVPIRPRRGSKPSPISKPTVTTRRRAF